MIRPLDRDTRGPARGSIAGSAPGPSRRITAASDTHLRPSRFRKDALTVHVTNHTKSRAPKTSPVLRSRRVASRVCSARRASPHESPATISWLGTRTWARACAWPAPRRSRAPGPPGTAAGRVAARDDAAAAARRFVLFPRPRARAPKRARARLVHAALQRVVRADLAARASLPVREARLATHARGVGAHVAPRRRRRTAPRRRDRVRVRNARSRRHLRSFSAYASTHATPAAAPEPSLPSASSSAAPTYSVQRAMSPSRPARPDSWYRPSRPQAAPSARPSARWACRRPCRMRRWPRRYRRYRGPVALRAREGLARLARVVRHHVHACVDEQARHAVALRPRVRANTMPAGPPSSPACLFPALSSTARAASATRCLTGARTRTPRGKRQPSRGAPRAARPRTAGWGGSRGAARQRSTAAGAARARRTRRAPPRAWQSR